jgi:diaminohydroxyphosphoribosylaminopyrimidine deaminase/5-amino-6-(5-phosphoribosylamino)uracil reductase
VILDSGLGLYKHYRVVETADDDLLVFTSQKPKTLRARNLQRAGVEIVQVHSFGGRIHLESVLTELGRREILSVLLEAGPTLNGAALAAGIVHKLVLFYAPKISGESRVPFAIAPRAKLPPMHNLRAQQYGPDIAIEGYLQDVYK